MAFANTRRPPATGDTIRLKLRDIAQLFNSLDPSPFSEQDLDHDAEEFIVSWAREMPHTAELELVIHLATSPPADRATGTEEAVHHYFASRAKVKQRELRRLAVRWTSLQDGGWFPP